MVSFEYAEDFKKVNGIIDLKLQELEGEDQNEKYVDALHEEIKFKNEVTFYDETHFCHQDGIESEEEKIEFFK